MEFGVGIIGRFSKRLAQIVLGILSVVVQIPDDRFDLRGFGLQQTFHKPSRFGVVLLFLLLGNKFLTTLSNCFTNLNLTDMETCYKVFTREVIDEITPRLKQNRFGIEPEMTARIARRRFRIYEMSISYSGRTYDQGKKIGWRDGFRAIYCILKYNIFKF